MATTKPATPQDAPQQPPDKPAQPQGEHPMGGGSAPNEEDPTHADPLAHLKDAK